MNSIQWTATKEEKKLMLLIAKRALKDEQYVRTERAKDPDAEKIQMVIINFNHPELFNGKKMKRPKLIFDNTPLTKEQQEDFILTTRMDIEATHCNDRPLDLEKLLNFDDFNFRHDIVGIYNHLNRKTGKLGKHFLPRCIKR